MLTEKKQDVRVESFSLLSEFKMAIVKIWFILLKCSGKRCPMHAKETTKHYMLSEKGAVIVQRWWKRVMEGLEITVNWQFSVTNHYNWIWFGVQFDRTIFRCPSGQTSADRGIFIQQHYIFRRNLIPENVFVSFIYLFFTVIVLIWRTTAIAILRIAFCCGS